MSAQLIARSPDLRRLRDEGYHITIRPSGHLLVHDVPYVSANRLVRTGTLISTLRTAGDAVAPPDDHTMWFLGSYPCNEHGVEIEGLRNTGRHQIDQDLMADFRFSSKPAAGSYPDYYEKVTTYVAILESPAQALDPNATAKTFPVVAEGRDHSPFEYLDTASTRAGIVTATRKLALRRVAIVGLGGTGSYVFDLVAKAPVEEIHLFDPDTLYTHNAFRGPGAASIEHLRTQPRKVAYWAAKYAPLRRGIVEHPYALTEENSCELLGMNFVFVCIDSGEGKAAVVERLEATDIPFIDVGMGLSMTGDRLTGVLRTTTSVPLRREVLRQRVSLGAPDRANEYDTNVQVADLNALNAALAVIRWKKLYGFYADYQGELHCTYSVDTNMLLNEELNAD